VNKERSNALALKFINQPINQAAKGFKYSLMSWLLLPCCTLASQPNPWSYLPACTFYYATFSLACPNYET